jgi:glycine cleavage system regulatory protein
MTISIPFTVIGSDRPGPVERLGSTVADHDGNWLESHKWVSKAGKAEFGSKMLCNNRTILF